MSGRVAGKAKVFGRCNAHAVFMIVGLSLALSGPAIAQQTQEDDGAIAMGNQGRMIRGTVTGTAADKVTLKTEAGDTFQVIVTTNTRMMKDRQPVKLADIHGGDGIGAMGVVDAPTKTIHAAMLMIVDAAQIKKMKEDMGKTYISGKVTAIDELEITVHRSDGVTQKITVDEGTSFKKGGRGAGAAFRGEGFGGGSGSGAAPAGAAPPSGESITLADIKIGDMVVGPGALKAGVFVPTQLTVIDASARRRRPEGPEPAAAGTSPH